MKIIIKKASVDTFWYAQHIGEEFEVQPSRKLLFEYEIRDDKGVRYICYDDSQLIK